MTSHVNDVFDVLYCELFNLVIIYLLVNLLTFKIAYKFLPWLPLLSSVAFKKNKKTWVIFSYLVFEHIKKIIFFLLLLHWHTLLYSGTFSCTKKITHKQKKYPLWLKKLYFHAPCSYFSIHLFLLFFFNTEFTNLFQFKKKRIYIYISEYINTICF